MRPLTRHKKRLTAASITILLAAPAIATASNIVPNVFNNHPPTGWHVPPLSATCQRGAVTIHFGKTARTVKTGMIEGFSVIDPELKCVTNHEILIGKCAAKAPLANSVPVVTEKTDHGAGKPGDWSGVTELRASLVATDKALNCIHRVTGAQ